MIDNGTQGYYGTGSSTTPPKQHKSEFANAVDEFVKTPKAAAVVLLLFAVFTLTGAMIVNRMFSGAFLIILFALVYAVYFLISYNYSYRFTTISKILLPVTAFLFVSFIFNSNMITNIVTFLTGITVMLILFMDQSGIDVYSLKKMSVISNVIKTYIEKPLTVLASPFMALGARMKKGEKMSTFSLVLIGILCTIPVVIILIMLFSSADEMFKRAFKAVFELLSFKNIDKIFFSIIFGFIASIICSAVFFTLCVAENENGDKKEFSGKINAVAVSSFISVLILLEGFFSYIQIRFLFLGKLPDGTSYAQYARTGFFQIAAATIITIAIILLVSIFVKRDEDNNIPNAVKILLTVFSSCAVILSASAYFRMSMYIKNFGLSVKRICVCWLMALMLTILVGVLIKLWRSQTALFGFIVWTVVAFVIILNLMRVDTLVSKYNVDRYIKNPKVDIDIEYLTELSDEAVPQIERLCDTAEVDEAQKAIEYMSNRSEKEHITNTFVNFKYSTYKAEKVYDRSVNKIYTQNIYNHSEA